MLKLVRPEWTYKKAYEEMMHEWHKDGGQISPWPLTLPYDTDERFQKMIKYLNGISLGIGIADYVPSTTYWVYDEGKDIIIGAVNIRHYLCREEFETWGHIGYGVRPSERNKGCGTEILKMALQEAEKMNLIKVLVCCFENNLASVSVIERNGGIFESFGYDSSNNERIKRYWIKL